MAAGGGRHIPSRDRIRAETADCFGDPTCHPSGFIDRDLHAAAIGDLNARAAMIEAYDNQAGRHNFHAREGCGIAQTRMHEHIGLAQRIEKRMPRHGTAKSHAVRQIERGDAPFHPLALPSVADDFKSPVACFANDCQSTNHEMNTLATHEFARDKQPQRTSVGALARRQFFEVARTQRGLRKHRERSCPLPLQTSRGCRRRGQNETASSRGLAHARQIFCDCPHRDARQLLEHAAPTQPNQKLARHVVPAAERTPNKRPPDIAHAAAGPGFRDRNVWDNVDHANAARKCRHRCPLVAERAAKLELPQSIVEPEREIAEGLPQLAKPSGRGEAMEDRSRIGVRTIGRGLLDRPKAGCTGDYSDIVPGKREALRPSPADLRLRPAIGRARIGREKYSNSGVPRQLGCSRKIEAIGSHGALTLWSLPGYPERFAKSTPQAFSFAIRPACSTTLPYGATCRSTSQTRAAHLWKKVGSSVPNGRSRLKRHLSLVYRHATLRIQTSGGRQWRMLAKSGCLRCPSYRPDG